MIIKFDSLDSFLLKETKNKYFLFHGPNIGKVNECQEKVVKYYRERKKLDVLNLHSEELKKGRLLELFTTYQTPNIFGDHTLLSIYLSDEKLSKEIISCFSQENIFNVSVVIRSEQLAKNSIIRSFFEKEENCLIIPCYEETKKEKKLLIEKLFGKEKIHIESNQIEVISNKLPNDRIEIKNEIEKILILLKVSPTNHANVSISNFISDSLEIDNIQFINDIVKGDCLSFFKEYNKFTDFGNDNIKLLGYLLEHLYKLSFVQGKLREGKNIKQSMAELKPPIFFKYHDSFIYQIEKFKEIDIKKMKDDLIQCKKNFIDNKISSKYVFLFTILKFFSPTDLLKKT